MPLLSWQVIGADRVTQRIAAMSGRGRDLRVFWSQVFAPKYFGIVQDLFQTSGQPRGTGGRFSTGHWQPLSPKYKAWKDRRYPGRPILVREGRLKESVRWTGRGLGPDGVWEPTPRDVTLGSRVPYAGAHQGGTRHLPARPFLPGVDTSVFGPLLAAWMKRATGP